MYNCLLTLCPDIQQLVMYGMHYCSASAGKVHLQLASSISWITYSPGMVPLGSTFNRGADKERNANKIGTDCKKRTLLLGGGPARQSVTEEELAN